MDCMEYLEKNKWKYDFDYTRKVVTTQNNLKKHYKFT